MYRRREDPIMRPEDFERYRKMIRDAERMRRSLGDTSQIQRMVREVEQATRMARGAGNLGPSPAEIESLRREAEAAQWLSDPQILRAHADVHRIVAQSNSALAQMPDAATQRAILEAARYFGSREFQDQSDAVLQATRVARQRLGPQRLASAERIAAQRTAVNGSQTSAAERIRAGEGPTLLKEAAELAASPEVRETIERADPETLARLDEEQPFEAPDLLSWDTTTERVVYGDAYPEFTKEDLLEMCDRAQLVLMPLEAAFVILSFAAPPVSPVFGPLSVGTGGLIVLVQWSEKVISRWEDGPPDPH
jgi:hypothetical protein